VHVEVAVGLRAQAVESGADPRGLLVADRQDDGHQRHPQPPSEPSARPSHLAAETVGQLPAGFPQQPPDPVSSAHQ